MEQRDNEAAGGRTGAGGRQAAARRCTAPSSPRRSSPRRWLAFAGRAFTFALPLVSGCEVSATGDGFSVGFSIGIGMVLLANALYLKWRLEDEPDWLRRLVAFSLGLPFTFLTFLLVETDTEMAWRRRQARLGEGDPDHSDQEFRRELEMIRGRRRADPAPERFEVEEPYDDTEA